MRKDCSRQCLITWLHRKEYHLDLMRRLNDPERPVDPSEYVLRIHLGFETASADYAWLNRIVAIGRGAHVGDAIDYEVFEIR